MKNKLKIATTLTALPKENTFTNLVKKMKKSDFLAKIKNRKKNEFIPFSKRVEKDPQFGALNELLKQITT